MIKLLFTVVLVFASVIAKAQYCIPNPPNGINGYFIAETKLESLDTNDTGNGNSYKVLPDSLGHLTCFLRPGFSYKLHLKSGTLSNTTLAAWIDFNNDTILSSSEKLGQFINTFPNQRDSISFTVPFNCVRGKLKLRIRCADSPVLNSCTDYGSGQTIDYTVTMLHPLYEYFTTGWEFTNSGTDFIHGVRLNNLNNQISGTADGPVYNDYTRKITNLTACNTYKLFTIVYNNSGFISGNYIDGFIDYNNDGVFDISEKIDSVPLLPGINNDSMVVIARDYPGQRRLRVRLFTNNILREAEDYTVNITTASTTAAPTANFGSDLYFGCSGNCAFYGCTGLNNFYDYSCGNPTSWIWNVPGAIPATSTQQNPSFSFPTTGAYDVELIVSNAVDTDTIVKQVFIAPPVTSFSLGSNVTICSGDSVLLIGPPQGANCFYYRWSTGETSQQITAKATGAYFLRIESCTHTNCAAYDTVVVNFSPNLYNVTGGGSSCTTSTGFNVGLSDSDNGVSYQLFRDGTAVGGPVTGNGNAISFGSQSTNGNYFIRGTNNALGCSAYMNDTVAVSIGLSPNAYVVTGGGTYCAGTGGLVVSLTSSDTSVSYQLYRDVTPSGLPEMGTGSVLNFPPHGTPGVYTVIGTDIHTTCTVSMTGSVNINVVQGPAIFNVSGGGTFCGGVTGGITLDDSQTGVNYEIYESGIPTGISLTGTGSALNFPSPTVSGVYTVVASDTSTCQLTMNGNASLTINPAPAVFSISGGGYYCGNGSGVTITVDSSQLGMNYRLWTGGFPYGGVISGTGDSLTFTLTAPGTYVIRAVNTSNGCAVYMNDSVTILLGTLPDLHSVTGGGHYCLGGSGITLGLDTSQVGVNYHLELNGDSIGQVLSGTGQQLDFGLQTGGGTYTVVGSYSATGCSQTMNGTAIVVIDSMPVFLINDFPDTLCIFSSPLYLTGTPGGGIFTGDGLVNDTLYPSLAGIGYANVSYSYFDITNGCTYIRKDSVLIDVCNYISSTKTEQSILIYPNPANTEISVSFSKSLLLPKAIELISEIGHVLKKIDVGKLNSSEIRLNVSDLPDGIYLMRFTFNDNHISRVIRIVR
jgi:PKD repeat protein